MQGQHHHQSPDHSVPKSDIGDLAILGGTPALAMPLHVNRPVTGDRSVFNRYVDAAWDRRWFTNHGPLVQELEARLRSFFGVKHCIAACNGTVAMAMTLSALDVKGEVILPSYSFISTANTLLNTGLTPVFCDVDPSTGHLDPSACAGHITPRTSAIIPTHLWGRPCAVEAFEAIAAEHKIPLIFDAAHAFGCTHKQRPIGRFGNAEVFSFHATKAFQTFEGGAITTNDDALASALNLIRNQGFTDFDTTEMAGTNGKMPELCAAMGLTNLTAFEGFVEKNRRNYDCYCEKLGVVPGLRPLRYDFDESNNFQYIFIEIDEEAFGLPRDVLAKILHAERVIARRYFYPGIHRMEPFRTLYPHAGESLQHTEALAARGLLLPGGSGVEESEIRAVCELIAFVAANAADIKTRIAGQQVSTG